jgi:hypothetical protein
LYLPYLKTGSEEAVGFAATSGQGHAAAERFLKQLIDHPKEAGVFKPAFPV